ncbi:TerD family protein [Pseudonocardia saturnea]
MQLTKGANLTLPPARAVTVTCSWTPRAGLEADLSALVLVDGRVRGDADFVFYNQPASGDRRVVHAGKRADGEITDRIDVDLAGFDDTVGSVAFALSLDGAPGRVLADLGPVRVTVTGDGPVAAFVMDGLDAETAAVAVELYRRGAQWKVRAVGQGYRDGLTGLARDFGVDVVDEPAPDPVPAGIDWRHPPVPAGYEL